MSKIPILPRTFRRYLLRLVNPVPRAYGPAFQEWRALLEESQWWSRERLEEYQNQELARLVKHCYENVPYYREMFHRTGAKPEDIRGRQDLRHLPVLTKDIIRENGERLVARTANRKRTEFHTTGGTTGTPLSILLDSHTDSLRLAFEWRYYNWAGYRFGDRSAILRGRQVDGFERGARWEYEPVENALILSGFDMTDATMALYLEKLRQFEPKVIRGYPSNLSLLAGFAREKGIDINQSKCIGAVLTSSETLYAHQRQELEEVFGAPVFDLYGNTEQAGRLGQCECRNEYHDFEEHSLLEVLAPDTSGVGEMVATSFINYTMPMLRYRTGDMIRLSERPCACGRGLRMVSSLEGRKQDVALLKDGTPVSLTGFFFAVHVPEMAHIRKIQFQQEMPGRLRAVVVKGGHYPEGACEQMLQRMNGNLTVPFDLEVVYVSDIPATASGKHQFFKSSIRNGN